MKTYRDAIQVIFFDAADTLFEVRGSVGEIYSRIARRYGIQADAWEVQAAFVQAFQSQSPLAFSGLEGEELTGAERSWWFEVVRKVFAGRMPDSKLARYFEEIFEVFRTAEAWQLFGDTRPSLERLSRRGYRLGIISNFDSRLYDVLGEVGIKEFFDPVIISSRAGSAKPDARIFRTAVEFMQVSPDSAMHVGDSLQEDVQGAQGAGFKAVLLDRKRKFARGPEGLRVESLAKLCDLLGA